MPAKKVFETAEEAAEYIEFLRIRNRERAKALYDNKIKTDPEKYKQFLEKCKKPSNDYYHKNKNLSVEVLKYFSLIFFFPNIVFKYLF